MEGRVFHLGPFTSYVQGRAFRTMTNVGLGAALINGWWGGRAVIFVFLSCAPFVRRLITGIRAIYLPSEKGCNGRHFGTHLLFRYV